MRNSDWELVSKAKSGDRTAFEVLVEKHARSIYGLIYRMVRGNKEEAEDLTQETFLRAYQGLTKFRGDSQFSTWLHRIATNLTLNRLKKKSLPVRSIFEQSEDGKERLQQLPDPHRTPHQAIQDSELRQMLERALDHLTDNLRAVFILREIEGLPHDKIAHILNTTTRAVRVRLHRAKKELCKILSPYLEGTT